MTTLRTSWSHSALEVVFGSQKAAEGCQPEAKNNQDHHFRDKECTYRAGTLYPKWFVNRKVRVLDTRRRASYANAQISFGLSHSSIVT